MSNKTVVGVIVLLAVIGALAWWGLKSDTPMVSDDVANGNDGDGNVAGESVTVTHSYKDGSHTLEGTLTLPTPCHALSHDVVIAESSPEQVTINFTATAGEGICTQVLADKFFRVTFDASREAVIRATLNGIPLSLEFSDLQEGETK